MNGFSLQSHPCAVCGQMKKFVGFDEFTNEECWRCGCGTYWVPELKNRNDDNDIPEHDNHD